jgi:phosphoribosylaminoimidazole synthetase
MSERGLSYRDAGVDIDAATRAMGGIREMIRSTRTPDTLSDLGSFGGLYRVPREMGAPVLVASTDGVGTKLKLAFLSGRHGTVGEDLVNHCVNDILVQGARPLFFLDYIGMGRLEEGTVEALVGGITRGCIANGCALLGGETAEMPDFYAPGEYDLAGTVVGVVEESKVLDGSSIAGGDVVIGLASSGLHTNGYSLARRIVFERLGSASTIRSRARTARSRTFCSGFTAPISARSSRCWSVVRSTGWPTSPGVASSTTSPASCRKGSPRASRPQAGTYRTSSGCCSARVEWSSVRCTAPSTWESG